MARIENVQSVVTVVGQNFLYYVPKSSPEEPEYLKAFSIRMTDALATEGPVFDVLSLAYYETGGAFLWLASELAVGGNVQKVLPKAIPIHQPYIITGIFQNGLVGNVLRMALLLDTKE